jgi:hypothetical protein
MEKNMLYKVTSRYTAKFLGGHYVEKKSYGVIIPT